MSVEVPPNTGMMAFDFTVTGDPQVVKIACAINDENVFTLPAKYARMANRSAPDCGRRSSCVGKTALT